MGGAREPAFAGDRHAELKIGAAYGGRMVHGEPACAAEFLAPPMPWMTFDGPSVELARWRSWRYRQRKLGVTTLKPETFRPGGGDPRFVRVIHTTPTGGRNMQRREMVEVQTLLKLTMCYAVPLDHPSHATDGKAAKAFGRCSSVRDEGHLARLPF
jgi:hypothetical protein